MHVRCLLETAFMIPWKALERCIQKIKKIQIDNFSFSLKIESGKIERSNVPVQNSWARVCSLFTPENFQYILKNLVNSTHSHLRIFPFLVNAIAFSRSPDDSDLMQFFPRYNSLVLLDAS